MSYGFESTVSGESFFSSHCDIDFNGGGSGLVCGEGDAGYQTMPCAGVFSNFRGRTDVALGSGESFVMTLEVNGSSSTLTFTCDQTNQAQEDSTHQVTIAAGDRVRIAGIHYSGSAMIGISMGLKFVPDVPGQAPALGYFIIDSGSAGEYLPVSNGKWKDQTGEVGAKNVVPYALSWEDVYMETSGAPGSGGSYGITARLNGVSQSLSLSVSGTSQTTASDLSHNVSLAAGDDIDFLTFATGGGFVSNIRHGSVMYVAENVLRINGSATAGSIQTGSGSYSFNVTVPDAHSSVTVFVEDNGSADPTVTLDGTAMTKITAACKTVAGSSPHRITAWKTIDKAAGTYAVAVTPDGSVSRSWAVAYSWGGDGTDAPVEDTSGGNSGTGLTSISTTLSPASGSIGIDMLGMSSAISFTEDSPQTRLDTSDVNFLASATSLQASSSNATMGWTCSPSHDLVQSVIWMKLGGSGGSTFTATGAATTDGPAAAGSATSTVPTFTATLASTSGGAAAAGTATHTPPTFSATGAGTSAGAAAAATATHTAPTFTGVGSATTDGPAAAGSATSTVPTFSSTIDANTGGAAAAATATHVPPSFTADAVVTTGGAAAAASMIFAAAVFSSSIAATTGGAAASATATFAAPVFTAAGAATTGGPAATATATFAGAPVTASGAATIGGPAAAATMTHTPPTFTANGACTVGGAAAAGYMPDLASSNPYYYHEFILNRGA